MTIVHSAHTPPRNSFIYSLFFFFLLLFLPLSYIYLSYPDDYWILMEASVKRR